MCLGHLIYPFYLILFHHHPTGSSSGGADEELSAVLGVVLAVLLILCITTVVIALFALKRRTCEWLTQLLSEQLFVAASGTHYQQLSHEAIVYITQPMLVISYSVLIHKCCNHHFLTGLRELLLSYKKRLAQH